MSYDQDLAYGRPVSEADENTRATFVARTYGHLLGAISAFVIIECVLFQTGLAERIAKALMGSGSQMRWLLVLGGFMVIGWIATRTAHTARSLPKQYSALAAYVAAQAVIFVPILYIAEHYAKGGVIANAAIVTAVGFLALTIIAWSIRKDFSFLGGILRWAGFCAIGLIVLGAVTGFTLGTWFIVGMIALAGGAILYDTSNVIHHYPEDRYVGASLQLFASVALLFWYVLLLFMKARD